MSDIDLNNLEVGNVIYMNNNEFDTNNYSTACRIVEVNKNGNDIVSVIGITSDISKNYIDSDNICLFSEKPKYKVVDFSPKYYDKDLDIDGTADELFTQTRNGYITDTNTLDKINEILNTEGKIKKAEYVQCVKEYQNCTNDEYNIGKIKLDLFEIGHAEEMVIEEKTINIFTESKGKLDNVVIAIYDLSDDGKLGSGACVVPWKEFSNFNKKDLDVKLGEILNYNMVYEDCCENNEQESNEQEYDL